ncbi:alpha/beta hydrolase-fold protein [Herbiconiux sp. CPCC 205716]|uniref:Alpha/beta hydrolase-fold protein n=1 Tax=Herbiconiux gentiana TaxID=2970912 RepID=A0ABT2GHQ4_9MICO|nr:alpha/beta hydrolase-fold protein [Herbiconiux gentiana]MCS5714439.1 alpha/beta hydrolase-fold protein [Herbiconiux gentiana]
MNALLDIGIISGPFVIVVYALAAVAAVLLIAVRPSTKWRRARWLGTAAVALGVGALIGVGLTWLLSDTLNLFGAELTPVVRGWIAVGFAGILLALVSLWRASWRRVIASLLAVLLFAGTTAMSINIDFGQYPTVRTALGISSIDGTLPTRPTASAGDAPTIDSWTPPADLPAKGTAALTDIPGTVSGFTPRQAVVYLPPAALVKNPPKLPVLIVMSGQPGTPEDPLVTDKLQQYLDAYAAAHQGLAPIVVSPDQLGAPDRNPMCIDSAAGGNSATYLTVDVPNWIRGHLNVLDSPAGWGVGGLSQGGTCAIQLGAAHPELFSAILDASGELHPSLGDDATTIAKGFGGDAAAFAAAAPSAIMAANAPYADMFAVFGVGSADAAYLPGIKTLYADAQAAGMTATYVESPGSAHDATSWSYVFDKGLTLIADHWGLNR